MNELDRDQIEDKIRQLKLDRRRFLSWLTKTYGTTISAAALLHAPEAFARQEHPDSDHLWEALIVGSGFGGSVTAARLSKKWPHQVALLERGRRFEPKDFPRDASTFDHSLLINKKDRNPRLFDGDGIKNGLFDVRNYRDLDVVLGNGLGGGSLVYGTALAEPTHPKVDAGWPDSIKIERLKPYYKIFKGNIQARPAPHGERDEYHLPKVDYWRDVARGTGGDSKLLDVGVFFGKEDVALAMGDSSPNQFGRQQTACVYCAECALGCDKGAKSSMDMNYLYVAERIHGAKIFTNTVADAVVPLNGEGEDDVSQDGRHGYRVLYRDAETWELAGSLKTKRLVVAAGSLGTSELLLRNKEGYGTLPKVSDALGQKFSCNGDFMGLVHDKSRRNGASHGPLVTQAVDYNLEDEPNRSFVLEEVSMPPLGRVLEWFERIPKPQNPVVRAGLNRILNFFHEKKDDRSTQVSLFAFVGLDASDGVMSFNNRNGAMELRWNRRSSKALYDRMAEKIGDIRRYTGGQFGFSPTWMGPIKRNFTMHPLGGARLGVDSSTGVCSAHDEAFGQVFGYQGFYVADGSLIPSALGANPALTIAALAEKVAEGITGMSAEETLI